MPTQLVDLPDDILCRIAHFVHSDTEIPLPSFNHHWENFHQAINRNNNRWYLSFRSTCRRTQDILPPKGLHLVVTSWRELLRWSQESSSMRNGIRRLIVRIRNVPKVNKHSPTKLGVPAVEVYDLNEHWKTFIDFLSGLTSLEEIVIQELPFCPHENTPSNTQNFQMPSFDCLPKVKTIAFEVKCKFCSRELPKWFVPCVPNLQFMKFLWSFDKNTNLSSIIKSWTDRQGFRTIPLRVLSIKFMGEVSQLDVLKDIAKWCPTISELYICSSIYGNSTITPELTLCVPSKTVASPHEEVKVVEFWREIGGTIENCFEYNTGGSLNLLCDALNKFQNMTVYDGQVEVILDTKDPVTFFANTSNSKVEHQKKLRLKGINELTRAGRVMKLVEGIKAVAEALVRRVPTLQSGYFWNLIEELDDDEQYCQVWCRWTWTKTFDGQGNFQIVVDPVVDRYNWKSIDNTDGTTPKQH